MRAPITVLIPTYNAADTLPTCLGHLSEGLGSGLIRDLVVTDGGSHDATLEIADSAGATLVTGGPSRGGQLRRGAPAGKGAWLLVLHSDTYLQPGWSTHVQRALTKPGAYYFQLKFDARGFAPALFAGWANVRSRRFGLPYGDQGLLIDRETYEKVGGYADIPLMEDVALAQALRGRLTGLDAVALTSAQKYQTKGWLRRGTRNLTTLARYLMGTDPETLAQSYRR